VVFGQKRWFLYMIDKTPPGGIIEKIDIFSALFRK
jgi:hypothetical protein